MFSGCMLYLIPLVISLLIIDKYHIFLIFVTVLVLYHLMVCPLDISQLMVTLP